MHSKNESLVIQSFNLSDRGVVVWLQHNLQGLPPGTELLSIGSGKVWKVISRNLFAHTFREHRVFDNEKTSFISFSFRSIEALEKSKAGILANEAQNIYMYSLSPILPHDKPIEGEILDIKL